VSGSCDGKVAVVVGGTRGLGRATTLALAAAGARVVPTGRTQEAVDKTAEEVRAQGGSALPLAFDVSDPEASEAAMASVVEAWGAIDILIANAGISPYFSRPERVTPEMWDTLMNVNLRGLFFAILAGARPMRESGDGGSIVIVSSTTSRNGIIRGIPYVAAKGGLDAVTRGLAVDWAPYDIRVNAVAPGYIDTEMTEGLRDNEGLRRLLEGRIPMGRFASPEEVASTILYLASDESSYVTGRHFAVDGGYGLG
jgi:NAD(P)-dependent dehydrogenase (short-subunit alcohol dehydrogenase family)